MSDEQKFMSMAGQLRQPHGDDGIKTGEMMSKGNRPIIHDTFRALDARVNDDILEIGMGNGFYVKEILEKSPDILYTGCDYAALMVEESRKNNVDAIAAGRAEFIHASIRDLPFQDNAFNKAFTINTIYFWDDETTALSEIRRVLQPGGSFIIGFRPKHQSEKYPFTKYGFNQFSKEEVAALLSANGFSVIDIFENPEPPFEMNGLIMETENVVVVARKA